MFSSKGGKDCIFQEQEIQEDDEEESRTWWWELGKLLKCPSFTMGMAKLMRANYSSTNLNEMHVDQSADLEILRIASPCVGHYMKTCLL
ncbi:hypothetical protein M5689_005405 [Euphorbia peplus]|nr:hypothetical protein M5689_005405 [Euphorbia peplus]